MKGINKQVYVVCLVLGAMTIGWFARSVSVQTEWNKETLKYVIRGISSSSVVQFIKKPGMNISMTTPQSTRIYSTNAPQSVKTEIRVFQTTTRKKLPDPEVPQRSSGQIPVFQGIHVYTRDSQQWNANEMCRSLPTFQRATLKLHIGNTPIYIHDPRVDKYVSGSILRYGSWEGGYINLIIDLLKNNKEAQFLDIGANLGVFSLAAAKLGRKVIAVDPLKINVQRLCKSFEDGKLAQNATIVFNALSDEIQNVTLGKDLNNVGGTFVLQSKNNNKVKGSVVIGKYNDAITTAYLDHLLELPGFKAKNMIVKMDVEGYELKVLKSGKKFFDIVNIIAILMEWNFHRTGISGLEIIKFFKDRNYEPLSPSLAGYRLNYNNARTWPGEVLWKKKT